MNYASRLPIDTGGSPMQEYPSPKKINANYPTQNGVASSAISLHPLTSQIEVAAFGGQGAVIRWIPQGESATVAPFGSVISSGIGLASFDHYIPPQSYRRFVVPVEKQGSGIGGQLSSVYGLYQRVAVMNAGATASSVITTEY